MKRMSHQTMGLLLSMGLSMGTASIWPTSAHALDVKGLFSQIDTQRSAAGGRDADLSQKKEGGELTCIGYLECKHKGQTIARKAIEKGDLRLLDKSVALMDSACFSSAFSEDKGLFCDRAGSLVAEFISRHKPALDSVTYRRLGGKVFDYEYRACIDFAVKDSCTKAFKVFSAVNRRLLIHFLRNGLEVVNSKEERGRIDKAYAVARSSCKRTKIPRMCFAAGAMLWRFGDTQSARSYFGMACKKGYKKACKAFNYGLPPADGRR